MEDLIVPDGFVVLPTETHLVCIRIDNISDITVPKGARGPVRIGTITGDVIDVDASLEKVLKGMREQAKTSFVPRSNFYNYY